VDTSRIDVWLKLACVFKSRSEAAVACTGGHVRINDGRAKPAALVKVGDVLELTEPRFRRLVVLGIPERSIPKAEARTMYRDETPPEPPREVRVQVAARDPGSGRPTKKQRREMDRWRR
jgi:ribosome-associated heat shock protein Hsp15